MAFEGPRPFLFTHTVGAAVGKFRFLTLDANGNAVHATSHADYPLGVSQDSGGTEAGKPVSVAGFPCITKVTAGGAVSAGANLAPGADGKAVAATTGQRVWAVALEAATADGQVITVLAQYPGRTA